MGEANARQKRAFARQKRPNTCLNQANTDPITTSLFSFFRKEYLLLSPYLPRADRAFGDYAAQFAAIVSADPAAYGLTAADAAAVSADVAMYHAALDKAMAPDTRTTPSIVAKDAAKAVAVQTVRTLAQLIQRNKGLSNELKANLGLTLPDTTPTPVPAPTTQPLLAILGATPLEVTVRYADAATPTKRKKAPGTAGLLLFCRLGTALATTPDEASLVALVTRNPVAVPFKPANAGKVATFFAKWVTSTGKEGPWSSPVSMAVAG